MNPNHHYYDNHRYHQGSVSRLCADQQDSRFVSVVMEPRPMISLTLQHPNRWVSNGFLGPMTLADVLTGNGSLPLASRSRNCSVPNDELSQPERNTSERESSQRNGLSSDISPNSYSNFKSSHTVKSSESNKNLALEFDTSNDKRDGNTTARQQQSRQRRASTSRLTNLRPISDNTTATRTPKDFNVDITKRLELAAESSMLPTAKTMVLVTTKSRKFSELVPLEELILAPTNVNHDMNLIRPLYNNPYNLNEQSLIQQARPGQMKQRPPSSNMEDKDSDGDEDESGPGEAQYAGAPIPQQPAAQTMPLRSRMDRSPPHNLIQVQQASQARGAPLSNYPPQGQVLTQQTAPLPDREHEPDDDDDEDDGLDHPSSNSKNLPSNQNYPHHQQNVKTQNFAPPTFGAPQNSQHYLQPPQQLLASNVKHQALDRRLGFQPVPNQSALIDNHSYIRDTKKDLNVAAGHYHKKKKPKQKNKKKPKHKKKKKKKHHHDHGKYYMYAKVPKKKTWEFGYKRGNKKHKIERHEKGHKSHFKTKVKWEDKKSKGKGIHIWDYNHFDKKKKKF